MKSLEEFFEKNYSTPLFYSFSQKSFFRNIRNLIKSHHISDFTKGKRLLSMGFGNLQELNSLRKMFNCRITAIDIFKKKLTFYARELKRNNNFSLFQKDINEIDFEQNYFQTVFAKDVFCFVKDEISFFSTLKFILEKKGYFILNLDIYKEKESLVKHFNYKQYLHHKLPIKNLSVEKILNHLKQNSFKIIEKQNLKKDILIIAQKK